MYTVVCVHIIQNIITCTCAKNNVHVCVELEQDFQILKPGQKKPDPFENLKPVGLQ